jgi:hypothetical protein
MIATDDATRASSEHRGPPRRAWARCPALIRPITATKRKNTHAPAAAC